MANVAYSHVTTLSQGIQYGRTAIVDQWLARLADDSLLPGFDQFPEQRVRPQALRHLAARRSGRATAARSSLTAQYLRSLYKNNWQERNFGDSASARTFTDTMFERRLAAR